MNRDEHRLRYELNKIRTLINKKTGNCIAFPIDIKTGGTWFGTNSFGIVLALLNRYQNSLVDGRSSRGEIIPSALSKGSFSKVFDYCKNLQVNNYNPFDLILISEFGNYRFKWNGVEYKVIIVNIQKEFFITSSSVNTDFILKRRKSYFKRWLKQQKSQIIDELDILLELHLQQETFEKSQSIFMSREHSHTKSISQISLSSSLLNYQYFPETKLNALVSNKKLEYSMSHSFQLPLKIQTA